MWYVSPGRAEIRQEWLGPLAEGAVRVRSRCGAISRGTEALIAAGKVPSSEHQRMRGPHMGGSFPFPVKYGYSAVGRVEAGPDRLVGRDVFVLHPHQTVFDVPVDAALPVPGDVPLSRAVLAANMETALNATWDAEPLPSGRIAVVGAGVVGALVGFLCARERGAQVTLIDINPARAELARTLGLNFATPDDAPVDCELVVHASADPQGLATALDVAGDESTVLELSWYGAGSVPVPLGGAFHSRRLKIVSSQVGQVAPSRRATTSHRQRLQQAIELLADARLDALLMPAVPFAELPERLPDILSPKRGMLCQLIAYP
ncbi:MAG: dehydrogenase [Burkholderiaceae bacterium]|nr:dehydrogenase [Burkholderiaceae bacterium]